MGAIGRYGRDRALKLGEYWDKHKLAIANQRRWDCKGECGNLPACLMTCRNLTRRLTEQGTLRDYDRYIRFVSRRIKNTPISEISLFELCRAIEEVRKEHQYSLATAGVIASALRRVFAYAAEYGDAADITEHTRSAVGSLDVMALLGGGRSDDFIRQALREERDKLAHKTMSLTPWQIKRLTKLLWERIELDGRYCPLCLMLYAGVRPAEGRALRWKDISPFIDHPEREIINIFHIRDAQGCLQQRAKTDNAYRRIPIHVELAKFLRKRREFVEMQTKSPIDELPICCYENEFDRPCRDYEAANLAKILFHTLKLSAQDLYAYRIQCLSERYETEKSQRDEDQPLTLYVLRRNFWTYMQATTRLSDLEKRVIMGHELEDWQSRRSENDENSLWEILGKLDHMVLSRELHEQSITIESDMGERLISNQGVTYIHLTPEMLAKGIRMQLVLTTEEAGDEIRLKTMSPVRGIGGLPVKAKVTGIPPVYESRKINLDLPMWQAYEKPSRPQKKKEDA